MTDWCILLLFIRHFLSKYVEIFPTSDNHCTKLQHLYVTISKYCQSKRFTSKEISIWLKIMILSNPCKHCWFAEQLKLNFGQQIFQLTANQSDFHSTKHKFKNNFLLCYRWAIGTRHKHCWADVLCRRWLLVRVDSTAKVKAYLYGKYYCNWRLLKFLVMFIYCYYSMHCNIQNHLSFIYVVTV